MDRKLITPVAIYSLIIISVILTAYSVVGLYISDGKSITSLFLKSSPGEITTDRVSEIIKEILPTEAEDVRPYKFKDKTISFSYYKTQEGFDFISYGIDEEMDALLTEDEKTRVNSIASNIYRPCCGVPASTPDCSHGFAARGLVELLVKEGWTDEQIYDEVAKWNRFWWPKHYTGVALYLEQQGKSWKDLTSKELLSQDYSTSRASRTIGSALGMSLF